MRPARSLAALVVCVAVTAVAAAAGGAASVRAASFYAALDRPAWAPPAWLFGPVWTALYLLMAIVLYFRPQGLFPARG